MEPFKCDNSRLLAECNSLHLDMIRQSDDYQQKILELNKTIRIMEFQNHELKQQCDELYAKMNELDPKQRKSRNDSLNQKRKPFISTVRSGEFFQSTFSGKSLEDLSIKKTQLELTEVYKAQAS